MRFTVIARCLVVVALLGASAGEALAQAEADKGQARALGEEGFRALDARQWAKAADLLQRAESLYHAPTLLVGLARAQVQLGKFVEAWESYHRVVIEGAPPNASAVVRAAVDEAAHEIVAVERRRATIAITVRGVKEPSVLLDGAPLSTAALATARPINPGTHAIHASALGYEPIDVTFTVGEGASRNETIVLEREPAAPVTDVGSPAPPTAALPRAPEQVVRNADGSSTRTFAYVAFGLGAVGVVTGAVTGVLALAKRGSIASSSCASGSCASPQSYDDSLGAYHAFGTVSTIGFVAAIAGVATGVTLLVASPSTKDELAKRTSTSAYVTLGGAGIFGSF